MSKIYATRYHDISCGHRVFGHESKCAHLHGHNYRIHFTVEADDLDEVGRVMDFSSIKMLLCKWVENAWDHKFLVWKEDPIGAELEDIDFEGVIQVPFNPTAENMATFLGEVVAPRTLNGTGVRLIRCTVEETRKCAATWEVAR